MLGEFREALRGEREPNLFAPQKASRMGRLFDRIDKVATLAKDPEAAKQRFISAAKDKAKIVTDKAKIVTRPFKKQQDAPKAFAEEEKISRGSVSWKGGNQVKVSRNSKYVAGPGEEVPEDLERRSSSDSSSSADSSSDSDDSADARAKEAERNSILNDIDKIHSGSEASDDDEPVMGFMQAKEEEPLLDTELPADLPQSTVAERAKDKKGKKPHKRNAGDKGDSLSKSGPLAGKANDAAPNPWAENSDDEEPQKKVEIPQVKKPHAKSKTKAKPKDSEKSTGKSAKAKAPTESKVASETSSSAHPTKQKTTRKKTSTSTHSTSTPSTSGTPPRRSQEVSLPNPWDDSGEEDEIVPRGNVQKDTLHQKGSAPTTAPPRSSGTPAPSLIGKTTLATDTAAMNPWADSDDDDECEEIRVAGLGGSRAPASTAPKMVGASQQKQPLLGASPRSSGCASGSTAPTRLSSSPAASGSTLTPQPRAVAASKKAANPLDDDEDDDDDVHF
eukprot:TRINITY_DN27257_c0_g1_i1.p1 TRINITY_DN27257_c0_g1~~TRINITY_DN27257_c0_g1_i1.p1  ORF type:complete len:503 (-),score=104.03 TRINITY_DN27257_c0_g1_i1:119-1627(-)